jgi:hypothetical protein
VGALLGPRTAGDGYAGQVVRRLAELRKAGVEGFDEAWRQAIEDVPAPWSWRPRPALGRTEAPLTFLEKQCRSAWLGEGSAHADLRALLLVDGG